VVSSGDEIEAERAPGATKLMANESISLFFLARTFKIPAHERLDLLPRMAIKASQKMRSELAHFCY
jgi:hypothetical protein